MITLFTLNFESQYSNYVFLTIDFFNRFKSLAGTAFKLKQALTRKYPGITNHIHLEVNESCFYELKVNESGSVEALKHHFWINLSEGL